MWAEIWLRGAIFCPFSQKSEFFYIFFCRIDFLLYLCTRNKHQWWIHLRARIRASHARHRGSNPLSTTKKAVKKLTAFSFFADRKFGLSVAVWQSCLHFGRRLLRNVSYLRELLLPKINFRPSISQIRQSSIAPTSFALLKPAATGRIPNENMYLRRAEWKSVKHSKHKRAQ